MLRKLYRSLRANPVLWASGIAAVLCFILLWGHPEFTNASRPSSGLPPVLAIQFAASPQEVDNILSDAPSPDREVLRLKTYIDFAFIASYATFFVTLARKRADRWLLAAVLALAMADVIENLATLRLIDTRIALTTQGMMDAIRWSAIQKWILAVAVLAFVLRQKRTPDAVLGSRQS